MSPDQGADGIAYGPDLSTVNNRSKSGIMIDILKLNRAISDGYVHWIIKDNSGAEQSGIITAENPNTLKLKIPSGEEILIQQNEVSSKTASEFSAMPEGLHNQLSVQEMADLLEFLKFGKTL